MAASARSRRSFSVDWLTVAMYLGLVLFGWVNIYSASVTDSHTSILNVNYNYGKQLIWILVSMVLGSIFLVLDTKLTEGLSYLFYILVIVLLIAVLVLGRDINGARGWFVIGPFRLQPAEFAKLGVALAAAKFMSSFQFSLRKADQLLPLVLLIVTPMLLMLLQPDLGSAIVFSGLILMLYREGMSEWVLILGAAAGTVAVMALLLPTLWVIGVVCAATLLVFLMVYRRKQPLVHMLLAGALSVVALSVNVVVEKVMAPHQRIRIKALFSPEIDPLGTGYNMIQSKVAVGSGGWTGKGFLEGTQTKFNFVPMQDTDFIFCTIGEEYGWLGTTAFLLLLLLFMGRLLYLAENTRTRYGRIFGYSVASYFFIHTAINIGMTIGLVPVIGIPLPFFSYGGSSLLAFTLMLALLLNHHANRNNVLGFSRLT